MSCKRKRQPDKEMAEKCCFICNDSGHEPRICDSNCLKVYHPGCVRNKDEFMCGADHHQVVDSFSVLNGEPSEGATERIHDCLNILNEGSSEVVSKQGDATREVVNPGLNWSVVNSEGGDEEKRDAEERAAQSSSETSEPKKPRLSEDDIRKDGSS